MTLGLAGVIAMGGTGLLSQKISDAKTEKIITTVEKGTETGNQTDGVVNGKEQNTEKEVFHKKYGIYLPESAEIKEETGDSLRILWNGCEFIYHLSYSEKQKESDMSVGDAVKIAIEAVQKYGKQDVTGKKIEISLQKNLPPKDESGLVDTDGDILDIDGDSVVVNRKNYGVRYYAVDISGIKLHQYSLMINSVTGEVFGYVDYHDRGANAEYGKEFTAEELEKLEPELKSLAEKFVDESMDLEKAKAYNFVEGLMDTENACREIFMVYCKTKDDDVVVVTMDPVEKSVLCFEINPIF